MSVTTVSLNSEVAPSPNDFLDRCDRDEEEIAFTEEVLGFLGYIPVISDYSAYGRITLAALLILRGSYILISSENTSKEYRMRHYVYILHGGLNLFRAFVTLIPIIGSGVTLFYDFVFSTPIPGSSSRKAGRLKYPGEYKKNQPLYDELKIKA